MKKNKEYVWDSEYEQGFQSIKDYLGKAPLLANPMVGEELYMYISFMDKVVNVVLIFDKYGKQQPVYYVSHSLTKAQQQYPSLDKAAFKIRMIGCKLRHYFGTHIIVVLT